MIYLAAALVVGALAPASYHSAEPVAAPSRARFVVKDSMWRCGPNGCAGGGSNSRPAIVCAALAKEIGALRGFSAAGKPFTPEEMEKCNRAAR